MADMDSLVSRFIAEKIALRKRDISDCAKSREWLLSRVKHRIEERVDEPVLFAEEPFVRFGSYFKGTKVSDVDEFDILVVIDSASGVFTQGGIEIGEGLGTAQPNHKYDGTFHKSDGSGVSPAKILNWLKGIVTEVVEPYGGTAPERCGQAVTARIEKHDLSVDLVPAGVFRHKHRENTTFYDIPSGDATNGWILTDPRHDMELIEDIARECDEFRNVIRIVKYVKGAYNFLIPSFAVECCLVWYVRKYGWQSSLFNNLLHSLHYLALSFSGKSIPDTFNEDNNLLSGVESVSWYGERVLEVCKKLVVLANEGDQEKAYVSVVKALSNA